MQKIDQPILFAESIALKSDLLEIQHHFGKIEAIIKDFVEKEESMQVGIRCEEELRRLQIRQRVQYTMVSIFAVIFVAHFAVSIILQGRIQVRIYMYIFFIFKLLICHDILRVCTALLC